MPNQEIISADIEAVGLSSKTQQIHDIDIHKKSVV